MSDKNINLLSICKLTETHDLLKRTFDNVSVGNDPYFVLELPSPGLRGFWRIDLRTKVTRGKLNSKLYVSMNGNFEERYAHEFDRLEEGRYQIAFVALRAIQRFRLDPADGKCAFRIEELVASRIGVWEFMRRTLETSKQVKLSFLQKLKVTKFTMGATIKKGMTFARLPRKIFPELSVDAAYARWIAKFDFSGSDKKLIDKKVGLLKKRPMFSVVMPVFNTPPELLDKAIASVVNQIYPNWELCIADDASTDKRIKEKLNNWQRIDPRIKVVFRERNGHICEATNSAFALTKNEWIALLDHDDELRPHALAEAALAIKACPSAELIYSDEDKIDEFGNRTQPFFKPDFSLDLLRSQNYLNHLTIHRASNIRAVGGWRKGFEGSQDYDLNLRIVEKIDHQKIVHIPKVLYHWRAAKNSTALEGTQKEYAMVAAEKALCDHVKRLGLNATVEKLDRVRQFRVKYQVPTPSPLVSLIIPTRDNLAVLRKCIDTIIQLTDYPNYEILIVDNQSQKVETKRYLERLSKQKNIRVLRYNKKFNYSAINNFAVAKTQGVLVGLLNNDLEVISNGWLSEMVSHAVRPEIGCVGAKLYYPDGRLQHGGVVLGLGGVAGHSHKYARKDETGYFHRLSLVHNVSAVTGACLLVRKEIYEKVGGLNEQNLPVAFNDVDFCIRVAQKGYKNLWTPFAELVHHESVSRGVDVDPVNRKRFESEISYMKKKWKRVLSNDPYYSPNLTKDRENFEFAV